MTVFLFFLGIAQVLLIWSLGQAGYRQKTRAEKDKSRADTNPLWPTCALIIPVSGEKPEMESALRSLLEQDYPNFHIYMVTATEDDPARTIVELLQDDYDNMSIVTAGLTEARGQKNHNLLAGIAAAGNGPDVYVFCDSTHIAAKDFLRCLVLPIAAGEAAFSTGYHQVVPGDSGLVTLAYAISVLFMRLMQGQGALTQPWGGAMAMSRSAFSQYQVAKLWAGNVVDDCSLGALLQKEGAHVRFCPAALLETFARGHTCKVWRAWLERQILFLKFCMPGQWIILGAFSFLMIIPPIWCLIAVLDGMMNIGGGMAPFLALCWFCLIAWAVGGWTNFFPEKIVSWRWLTAFFCACAMFAATCFSTIGAKSITWQNILYQVGKKGSVKAVVRK